LSLIVGYSKSCELVFTGRQINAREALSINLVNAVVTSGEAVENAVDLGRTIANNAPLAVRASKKALRASALTEVDADAHMRIERACYHSILNSKDRLEGINAFIEKRIPCYKGS